MSSPRAKQPLKYNPCKWPEIGVISLNNKFASTGEKITEVMSAIICGHVTCDFSSKNFSLKKALQSALNYNIYKALSDEDKNRVRALVLNAFIPAHVKENADFVVLSKTLLNLSDQKKIQEIQKAVREEFPSLIKLHDEIASLRNTFYYKGGRYIHALVATDEGPRVNTDVVEAKKEEEKQPTNKISLTGSK